MLPPKLKPQINGQRTKKIIKFPIHFQFVPVMGGNQLFSQKRLNQSDIQSVIQSLENVTFFYKWIMLLHSTNVQHTYKKRLEKVMWHDANIITFEVDDDNDDDYDLLLRFDMFL